MNMVLNVCALWSNDCKFLVERNENITYASPLVSVFSCQSLYFIQPFDMGSQDWGGGGAFLASAYKQ